VRIFASNALVAPLKSPFSAESRRLVARAWQPAATLIFSVTAAFVFSSTFGAAPAASAADGSRAGEVLV
jgi:hypothetical protein